MLLIYNIIMNYNYKILYKKNINDKWIEIYNKHIYIKDAIEFYKRNRNNILYYDEKHNIRLILLIYNRYNHRSNIIEKIGLTNINDDGIIFLQINDDGTTLYLKLLQKRYEKRIAEDFFYNDKILINKDDVYYYDNKYKKIIEDIINDNEWF
jgi:hypothetical protein